MKGKYQKKFHRGNNVKRKEFIARCREIQHEEKRQRETLEGAYKIEQGYSLLCGIRVPEPDTLVAAFRVSACPR